MQRLRITIYGIVQGVGFRPFVYKLAEGLHLKGWVNNSCEGVTIEIEGPHKRLDDFLARVVKENPEPSRIHSLQYTFLEPAGYDSFEIRQSDTSKDRTVIVMPDLATCPECIKEVFDANDRRYLYPFTNCTHCGPRYSIIESIPYDRTNTSMKGFQMCADCLREYHDPADRRFHAQPNACPVCGPHMELWDVQGNIVSGHHDALLKAVEAVKGGKVVAVKGLGGFHLLVDARNEKSVRSLRERKHREEKPLALMMPSLEMIEEVCTVSEQERRLLMSPEAPIVLLPKRDHPEETQLTAPSVAPGNPYLGVMLPYSPLHHILMGELQIPVVATSGNLSDEPICTDEREALRRLDGIADVFLVHNRPIVRSVDDSVVRTMMDRPLMMRRSRGYAPLPVGIKEEGKAVLAFGGHLKNTVALSIKNNVFISQHIGDLETDQSLHAFHQTIESLRKLYEPDIQCVVCDKHPEYISTKCAQTADLPLRQIQHHHAHIVSCMAENHLDGRVLGISWDGTGFGEDRTVWGGEFLLSTLSDFKRAGYFRTFRLPGGEKAIQEPRRTALGLLEELSRDNPGDYRDLPPFKAFKQDEIKVLRRMVQTKINSPRTSSAGRVFDAVASILDVHQIVRYEGQAAMALEYLLQDISTDERYNYAVAPDPGGCLVIDWQAMIREMIDDVRSDIPKNMASAKFHNTLVETAVDIAARIKEKRVVLSGGCFQNKYLTERLIRRLREEGFMPFWHQWVPPNDGGISLGQAVAGINRMKENQEGNQESRVVIANERRE